MATCAATTCGTCVVAGGQCGFCDVRDTCFPAGSATSGADGCSWEETYFLPNECPEESILSIWIGIAAALVAIFVIWMIWRGWTSKARHGLKHSTGMDAVYENAKIVDCDFKDITLPAFAIDPAENHPWGLGKQHQWNAFRYYVGCIASFYYVWGLLGDGLAFRSMYATGRQSEAVFYAATVIISLVLIGYDIFQAHRIFKLDDVSDGYLNADVVRYRSLRLHDFTFFYKLGQGVKFTDKIALFLFNSLIGAPRLAFVEVPQLILVIITNIKVDSSLMDRCGAMLGDASCRTNLCEACVDEHGPDVLSNIGLVFKIIFLGMALFRFGVALFLYPCVRGIIQVRYVKLGGKDFTLTGYCSYLIDIRITDLLIKTPGAVTAEFWESRGRTPDGEKKSLKEKASEVKQAAIEKVQETKAAAIADINSAKTTVVETKQEAVDRAIEIKENVQDKVSAGQTAMKNAFSTGKGVLNVLTKREGGGS